MTRKAGFKHSEETKEKIRASRKGKTHNRETKEKISASLYEASRKKHTLSKELTFTYGRAKKGELKAWISKHKNELNSYGDVLSSRKIYNINKVYEVPCGEYIEVLFGHSVTPELLLMYKQSK
jgi:hypothetical protein